MELRFIDFLVAKIKTKYFKTNKAPPPLTEYAIFIKIETNNDEVTGMLTVRLRKKLC